MHRSALNLFALLALCGSGLTGGQEVGEGGLFLEEIIVTATKRKVGLQDLPMSLGVLTESQLREINALTMDDVWRLIPNLNVRDAPFGGNSVAQENSKELMGLAVGMHKQEVFKLAGVAGFIEGYDWGSVWFYQTKDGGEFGTLNDRHVQERYTPVVFGNTDHVIGYGPKFYDQTIKDLGTGNY